MLRSVPASSWRRAFCADCHATCGGRSASSPASGAGALRITLDGEVRPRGNVLFASTCNHADLRQRHASGAECAHRRCRLDLLLAGEFGRVGTLGCCRGCWLHPSARRSGFDVCLSIAADRPIDTPIPLAADGEPLPAVSRSGSTCGRLRSPSSSVRTLRRLPTPRWSRRLPIAREGEAARSISGVRFDIRVSDHPCGGRPPWSNRACRGRSRGTGCRSRSARRSGCRPGHRPQAAPERRLREIAAEREEIAHDMLEGVAAGLVQLQRVAASSAVPPTRIRSPSRVTATLWVSSITVDSGAPDGSTIGTVIE